MHGSRGAGLRLQADLRDIERQPLPLVSARYHACLPQRYDDADIWVLRGGGLPDVGRPLENDLFTWHCNLMGPGTGCEWTCAPFGHVS